MALKQQVQTSFVPPRSWHAWRAQVLQAAILGILLVALLLAFTGLDLDDTRSWIFLAVFPPVVTLVSAIATARRISTDKDATPPES